jgi:hypothetical protein
LAPQAEEHGKAVERFRQAERQRLLEMDLEDQLLALEHEELELMAVRERATVRPPRPSPPPQ